MNRISQWIIVAASLCAGLAAQADDLLFKKLPVTGQAAEPKLALRDDLPLKAIPAKSSPSADGAAKQADSLASERWTVELSDGSMSRALKRWGERAGMPLVWEAPKDKPAFFAVYSGTFEEAVTKAMRDTRPTDYRLHACGHDNVVRILHASQRCIR